MLRAIFLSSSLILAPVAVQAGSISLGWSPRTADEQAAVSTALGLYAIHKALKSRADLRQSGSGLAALIAQSGRGQFALIDQKGADHSARVSQSGAPNGAIVVQRGSGTEADVIQRGGAAAILLHYGW